MTSYVMIHHFSISCDLNLDERNLPNYSYIANKQEWRKLEQNHFRFWSFYLMSFNKNRKSTKWKILNSLLSWDSRDIAHGSRGIWFCHPQAEIYSHKWFLGFYKLELWNISQFSFRHQAHWSLLHYSLVHSSDW